MIPPSYSFGSSDALIRDFRGIPFALCHAVQPFELRPRQKTEAALGLSNRLFSFKIRLPSIFSVSSAINFNLFSGEGHEGVLSDAIILPESIVNPF